MVLKRFQVRRVYEMIFRMKKKTKALICIAHPDDETIFFGGLILSKQYDWTAVCVTDANADGQGAKRMDQFRKACRRLNIQKTFCLNYPDIFSERVDTQKLILDLKKLGSFQKVLTHGPLGEYGHIHHQDVSWATYQVFGDESEIISPAYNVYPEIKISLSKKDFQTKIKILREIYAGESMRFLGLLPATSAEGYVKFAKSEVDHIYQFIIKKQELEPRKLKHYRWLVDYIRDRLYELKMRPF